MRVCVCVRMYVCLCVCVAQGLRRQLDEARGSAGDAAGESLASELREDPSIAIAAMTDKIKSLEDLISLKVVPQQNERGGGERE